MTPPKPFTITNLLLFFILLTMSTISHADLGLNSDDFKGKRVSGNKVTGSPVTGNSVTGTQVTVTGTSTGTGGRVDGTCPVNGGGVSEEGSGCGPCSGDSKASSVNSDLHFKTNSFVNLFSRKYQDEKVDMSVKGPGGFLKVYRVYHGEKWKFEHEYNKLDLSAAETGNIEKSTYTYRKKEDGLYHYKTFTIQKVDDQYRWENKTGDYTIYSKEGLLVEGGNRYGAISKYIYQDNKLISIQDRNNSTVYHFQHDAKGKITTAEDEHSRKVTYNWQDDQLLEVTDVLDHVTTYNYNPEGLLISKSDEADRKFLITYHPDGAVQSVLSRKGGGYFFSYEQAEGSDEYYAKVTSSMGNIWEYWYDTAGETKKIKVNGNTIREDLWHDGKRTSIDELGSRTVKSYDDKDNLVKVEFIDGTSLNYKYDSKNNLISNTNELGIENRYSHNKQGQVLKKWEAYKTPEQILTTFQYDSKGNLLGSTVHNGEKSITTSYQFDNNDNLTEITDPLGGKHQLKQDFMGNVIKTTNPVGLSTLAEYDPKGNILSTSSPDGQKLTFAYDAAGRRVTTTDKSGNTTHYTYDCQDNLIKTEDALGGVSRFNFDKDNRLTKKVDEEGKYHILFYDEGSRRISKIIDGSSNEIDITYRGFENCGSCPKTFSNKPVRIEFPTFTRQFQYDHRGRLIEKSDTIGTEFLTEKYAYDKGGRLISSTNRNGLVTVREYDSLNRIKTTTDPTGGKTTFTYDTIGKLIGLLDAKGQTTKFEYDLLGNKTKETRPLGNSLEYLYDTAGRLLQRTDGEGQQISYLYHEKTGYLEGYLLKKSQNDFAGEIVQFTYDDHGHLAGYDDRTTSAKYEYDALGRRLKVTTDYKKFTSTHSYTYYKNGLKKSFTSPDGRTHKYSYTPINKLQGINIEGVGDISYTDYNWLRPQKVSMPGVVREDSYDNFLRLTKRKTLAGEKTVLDLTYQYNITNNIISRQSGESTTDYTYDELERLIGVQEENKSSKSYELDPVGNRLSTSSEPKYTYDENNQLLAVGDTSYSYDKNGNTTQKTSPDQTTHFTYNFENRLSNLKREGLEANYYYDPFGRRLCKEVNGKITWFAYSDEGIAAEFDATGGIQTTYTWKPGSTWSTDPLMLTTSRKNYFYHNDHLGAPQSLTDKTGKVVWQASYDVYGDVEIIKEEISNNLRFPGQYLDNESGLYYNWHRFYDPSIGRYLNADPIGLAGGINMFAYVGGNPVMWADPWGLLRYEIDSQGFHFHVPNSTAAQGVNFNKDGSYSFYDKPGHPVTKAQRLAAQNAFNKAIQNKTQQQTIRDVIKNSYGNYSDKQGIRNMGRNARRVFSGLNNNIRVTGGKTLGSLGYILMLINSIDAQARAKEKCISVWAQMIEDMGAPVIVIDDETGEVIYSSPGVTPQFPET